MRAITSQHIASANAFRLPIGVLELRKDCIGILRQVLELDSALNRVPEPKKVGFQQFLGSGLRQDQEVGIAGIESGKVGHHWMSGTRTQIDSRSGVSLADQGIGKLCRRELQELQST